MPDSGASPISVDSLGPHFRAEEVPWQRRPPQNPFGCPFPLVLRAGAFADLETAVEGVRSLSSEFKELLTHHGAIYVTGLPLPRPEDFNELVQAFDFPPFDYIGGAAPRTRVVGYTFTANEGPGNRTIAWHNEIAASINHPLELVFYCEVPAEVDGFTCVNYGAEVLETLRTELDPELVRLLEEKGFQYRRVLGPETNPAISNGRGWKDTYNVSSRTDCEEVLASLKVTQYEWIEDSAGGEPTLIVNSPQFPWSKRDPRTDLEVFFNAACGAHVDHVHAPQQSSLRLGDGAEMPAGVMDKVIQIVDSVVVKIPWEAGAILLVDNILCQHARTTYEGPRKVYASLWK
jgi:hypothetical protein